MRMMTRTKLLPLIIGVVVVSLGISCRGRDITIRWREDGELIKAGKVMDAMHSTLCGPTLAEVWGVEAGLRGYYLRHRYIDLSPVSDLALRIPQGKTGTCIAPTECQVLWLTPTPVECVGAVEIARTVDEGSLRLAASLLCIDSGTVPRAWDVTLTPQKFRHADEDTLRSIFHHRHSPDEEPLLRWFGECADRLPASVFKSAQVP
jgi:hypothetical protein